MYLLISSKKNLGHLKLYTYNVRTVNIAFLPYKTFNMIYLDFRSNYLSILRLGIIQDLSHTIFSNSSQDM